MSGRRIDTDPVTEPATGDATGPDPGPANAVDPEAAEPDLAGDAGAQEDADPPDSADAVEDDGATDEGDTGAEEDAGGLDLLAVTLRERDDYLDALRRLQADFENYKKRAFKQQADSVDHAARSLVDKLLPALDTADLAAAHTESEEVRQVRSAFIDALEREGLERIAPDGGPFDPTRHDAVAHEPGDGGDQEIADVLRAGYAWKGRVLRPAMVKVRG